MEIAISPGQKKAKSVNKYNFHLYFPPVQNKTVYGINHSNKASTDICGDVAANLEAHLQAKPSTKSLIRS